MDEDGHRVKTRRLFFALWPDDDVRQQIKRNSKSLLRLGDGRPVVPGNLHITLAFLGNVDESQQSCVEHFADDIQCPAFSLALDQADYWPKPRVLWIGPSETPKVMVTLATELRDGAIGCGLQMDMRPYRAHMTLMRKVARARVDMTIRPFHWHASSFTLVKSVTYQEGVKYEVIREWPLSGS